MRSSPGQTTVRTPAIACGRVSGGSEESASPGTVKRNESSPSPMEMSGRFPARASATTASSLTTAGAIPCRAAATTAVVEPSSASGLA